MLCLTSWDSLDNGITKPPSSGSRSVRREDLQNPCQCPSGQESRGLRLAKKDEQRRANQKLRILPHFVLDFDPLPDG